MKREAMWLGASALLYKWQGSRSKMAMKREAGVHRAMCQEAGSGKREAGSGKREAGSGKRVPVSRYPGSSKAA